MILSKLGQICPTSPDIVLIWAGGLTLCWEVPWGSLDPQTSPWTTGTSHVAGAGLHHLQGKPTVSAAVRNDSSSSTHDDSHHLPQGHMDQNWFRMAQTAWERLCG